MDHEPKHGATDGIEGPAEETLSLLERLKSDHVVSPQTPPVEPFLAAIVASSADAIIGKTLSGEILSWNAAAERLYGYPAVEMIGRNIATLIPRDRPDELPEILQRIRRGGTVQELLTERVKRNGTLLTVSVTVSPVFAADGGVIGAATRARDMTSYLETAKELDQAHRATAEALSMLETLQASAPVGLGFIDREFRITHLNQVLAEVNGSSVSEQIGKTVSEVVPEIWPQTEGLYRRVLEDDETVLNIEVTGKSVTEHGHRRYWLASYYPVHLETEIIGVGIVTVDITDRRTAEEFRSIAMNNMDEGLFTVDAEGRLTSMNNAAAQMLGWTEEELLGKEMRHVVLGEGEGSASLEGGNAELLKVRSQGRHVRLANHAYRCKDGSLLPVAISASPLLIGESVDGAVIVFRDITEEKSEQLRIERELSALTWVGRIREALDEKRMVLYSQPVVPLGAGQPSEELLIRMVTRDGKLIAPGAFLPVAEKYGLITEIDHWVIREAVWLAAQGRHVGVNLSAESIVCSDLLALIEHEIHETRADPANLVFEITETALLRDIGKGEDFARGVVELGCGLALDDFGTGFGTFTHVKRLPIKYLKIDIEFVRDLVASSANQHVVQAIVNLAKGFGCQTVGEGVEDAETLKRLRDFGVDFAQGFYLGRPAPL